MILSGNTVFGRTIEAARILAGLDQTSLAGKAGVSPSTISNVENGNDARDDTIKSIKRALRKSGVTICHDKSNGLAFVAIGYDEPEDEED